MKRKFVFFLMVLFPVLLSLPEGTRAGEEDLPDLRVIIQVSEDSPKIMSMALNNAMNLVKAVGQDEIAIEVIAYGPGVRFLMQSDQKFRDRISSMMFYGIRFVACGNTLKTMHLPRKDLIQGVTVVQTGVLEIIQKQKQGWAYVRP